ncbi:hypothetical protein AHF37_10226 [Paragonimus kellicotti]|nr:hypothetical protein AHF37_10226 [Paragonimus kellicotti]
MNPSLSEISIGVGVRGSSSSTGGVEERNCHRNQINTTESVGRPLAIMPLATFQQGLLSHLNLPSREVGTTAPLVNNPSSPNNRSSLSGTASIVSTTGLNTLSHISPDANAVDLASLFECPVCMDYALPPILQCQSGHIVCAACRSKLSSCPTCRGNLDNIRNLAMEKLASSVMFPCKYSTSGCPETFHYTSKGDHEAVCEYRPYDCPCPGASCKWLGELEQVMPHLMHHHKSITTLQGEDIVFLATDINLPGAVDWVMMQSCFGHSFMLVLEKQERVPDQIFFALVQLIGTRKQAEQFVYR